MPEQIENRMVTDCEWRKQKRDLICSICCCPINYLEKYFDFKGEIICEDCIQDYLDDNYSKLCNE